MPRILLVLLVVSSLAASLAGCSHPKRWFTNTSIVRDPLVSLPDGGEIYLRIEQTERAGANQRAESYVWQQPERPPKRLAVVGSPREINPSSRTPRFSEDGKVVTLLDAQGAAIAVFDYSAGTASFARGE